MNGFGTGRQAATMILSLLTLLAACLPAAAGDTACNTACSATCDMACDNDEKIDLSFWGRVKFDTHIDTGNLRGFTDFASYLVTEDDGEMNFNPRDSRFGFAAKAGKGDWTYRAVVEMDFYGDNAGNNLLPRLRLGYTEACNGTGLSLRAGQDWIPIAQQNPGTVDFGLLAWGGNLWWRVPQVVLRQRVGDVELLAGAMKHRTSTAQEQDEAMPWFLGRIAMSDLLGENSLIAVGVGGRSVTVDDEDYDAWLVAGELRLPLGEMFLLNGEYYVGQGVGREFIHYGFDYNATHPDGPTSISSQGGFASLAIKARPGITFNLGYGMDNPDGEDLNGLASIPYLKNNVFFVNVKDQLSAQYGIGFEMMQFDTETVSGDLSGQRFTASTWFVF